MIIDPYRFAVAAASPWIAGQIGAAGDRLVMVSPDGVDWSTAPTYATGLSASINRIEAANGLILASSIGGTPRVRYSLDGGLTWGTPSGLTINTLNGLTKSGSYWVASGATTNGIYRSIDGITWSAEDTSRTFEEAIVFNSGVLVGSTNSTYQRSAGDGDTWTNTGIGTSFGTINFLAATSSHVIAGTSTSRAFIRRSATGLSGSWSSVTFAGSNQRIRGIAASPAGDVLMIDANRNIYYSNDSGGTWSTNGTLGAAGDTTITGCVSYGDGAWIIITYDTGFQIARIWRSTSVSGTFAEVGTFASNGAALGGVRYIGA
jgi:hypothetical protein